MKKGIVIILSLGIGFGLGWWSNERNTLPQAVLAQADNAQFHEDSTGSSSGEENFDQFLYSFMTDSEFQLNRIQFPLRYVHFKDGDPGNELITTLVSKNDWEHDIYFLNETAIPVVYDNHEKQKPTTDERMLVWEGVENGISVSSYFQRIDGK